MYKPPSQCPTCESPLTLRELGCPTCGTSIRGTWASRPFDRLSSDQQAFLILFVRSRGNLSEVERALGVSYPTVRGKLEEVIQALADDPVAEELSMPPGTGPGAGHGRREVLERVVRGEISPTDAVAELRRLQSED